MTRIVTVAMVEVFKEARRNTAPWFTEDMNIAAGLEAVFQFNVPKNQCDGCQANMFRDSHNIHRDANNRPHMTCQRETYR